MGEIRVPADVLEGLEFVRDSGETNMLDRSAVEQIALRNGYSAAAAWVRANGRLYAEGVFRGFEAEA